VRDYDDYIERECECGHNEHRGPCSRTHTTYYPPGHAIPANAEPTFTHAQAAASGHVAYRVPCSCTAFREYEGPGEPPDLDREAS
jgi:hypothetical protein